MRPPRMLRARRARTARAKNAVKSNQRRPLQAQRLLAVERRVGPPPRSLLGLPPVRSRPLVRAREGLRALRRWTRNSNRRSRPRRNRRRSRRRNRSRVPHRRISRSKCSPRQLSDHRNRRPVARPGALPLGSSHVNRRRAQGLPMLGRRQVPYPYGIRRRQQYIKKASGRGWGLEGKPSGQRATRQLRLPSSLGFRRRSRRLPHPVGSDLRQVRPLRAFSGLVRRCSRARRPGLSLGPVLVLSLGPVLDLSPGVPSFQALQRLRVWRPRRPPRFVRRRLPGRLAQPPRDPSAQASRPAVRPLPKAEHLFPQSPLPPDRKRACPPDRPLLPRGCRGRPCSLLLRLQSRYRARRATQQGTSRSVQVRKARRLTPTTRGSPRLA